MTHCLRCGSTEDVIEDDGPIALCRPCIKVMGKRAVMEADLDPDIAKTRTWKWMQDGLRRGRTSAS